MENSSVKTIDRLVQLLNCFNRDKTSWSLTELSTHLGLPKSTLHRFLVGLEGHGILRRGAEDSKWRMGHRLLIWGNLAGESTGLRQVAEPIMRELAAQTGETILLTEYHDGGVICIDKVETGRSVRIAANIGSLRSPHAGASSKILMAFLPDAEVQTIIREKGLPRLCGHTITDPAKLRQELALIRERGYAESYEETDAGAWGIATPIRDWRGEVVAGLGIVGPTVRFSERQSSEYVGLGCDAARRISALLGAGTTSTAPRPAAAAPVLASDKLAPDPLRFFGHH